MSGKPYNSEDTDVHECLFCNTTGNLYTSNACECKHVYYHKECMTQNILADEPQSKNCPQCRVPLNLTIGEPGRVCCCNNIITRFITVCNTVCNTIYNWFHLSTHIYIGIFINAIFMGVLLMTETMKRDKHNIEIFAYVTYFIIYFMYLMMFTANKKINYETYQYFCFTCKKEYYDSITISEHYSLLSPYTFIKINKSNVYYIFLAIFYIPLLINLAVISYFTITHSAEELSLKSMLLTIVPNIFIISAYIKYIIAHLLACGKWMCSKCYKCWTVKEGPRVITDDNISPV